MRLSLAMKVQDSGVTGRKKTVWQSSSVKDSGCGIDDENQKKLLHTDTHFSTFGTNNEEGSGLGLLLCQDFVVKNGGKLWFTSKKGDGSTFSFSIPLLEK